MDGAVTAPLANVTYPVIFYAAAVIIPPTPTPTPAVTDGECDAETIQLSQNALELQKGENREIDVTVKGENDCVAEGISVQATIKKGKKRISLFQESGITDENGQITFTITAKKKTGKATVVFKADGIKSKLKR